MSGYFACRLWMIRTISTHTTGTYGSHYIKNSFDCRTSPDGSKRRCPSFRVFQGHEFTDSHSSTMLTTRLNGWSNTNSSWSQSAAKFSRVISTDPHWGWFLTGVQTSRVLTLQSVPSGIPVLSFHPSCRKLYPAAPQDWFPKIFIARIDRIWIAWTPRLNAKRRLQNPKLLGPQN